MYGTVKVVNFCERQFNMLDPKTVANSDLRTQVGTLRQITEASPLLCAILNDAPKLGLSNCYLGGGCIAQTAWNIISGYELNQNIKDCDLVYFDSSDISYEAEDRVIRHGNQLLGHLPVEVEIRNQARVHLWYPQKFGITIEPFRSTEEAINMWPTHASSVGIAIGSEFSVYAPYGLHDLFAMIARPNKSLVTKQAYETKTNRWAKSWPDMKLISW